METGPTKFVGRISLSAESLRTQSIFGRPALRRFPGRGSPGSWEVGRYGNRPYDVCRATALLLGQRLFVTI